MMALTTASFGVPALKIAGARSVLQQLLLKGDDGAEHRFILDLVWRDYDAAVQEVGHSLCEFSSALRLKRRLVEHLRQSEQKLM